jgi:hypothetical protein
VEERMTNENSVVIESEQELVAHVVPLILKSIEKTYKIVEGEISLTELVIRSIVNIVVSTALTGTDKDIEHTKMLIAEIKSALTKVVENLEQSDVETLSAMPTH